MNDNARERLRADVLRDYRAPNPGLASRAFSLRAPERHDRLDPHRALQLVAVAVTVALVATFWVVGRHIVLPQAPGSGGGLLRPPASNVNVYFSDFISADVGWVLAGRKADHSQLGLFKTTDGGQHWTRQIQLPRDSSPLGLQFWPDGHGRVVWEGGSSLPTPTPTAGSGSKPPPAPSTAPLTTYTTVDGGAHWSRADQPFPGSVVIEAGSRGELMLTPREGWRLSFGMTPYTAALLHTTDGGRTWPQIADLTSLHLTVPSKVTFLDSKRGWISAYRYLGQREPYLYTTNDGGKTWSPQNLPLPPDAASGSVSVDEPFIFPGGHGLLPVDIVEAPGPSPAPGRPTPSPTPFLTPNHYVLVTSDGGRTWGGLTKLPFTSNNPLAAMFLTPSHWVFADGPTVYQTKDAGRTWSSRRVMADGAGLWFTPDQRIDDHTIVSADASGLFRTVDGGQTWTAIPLPPA